MRLLLPLLLLCVPASASNDLTQAAGEGMTVDLIALKGRDPEGFKKLLDAPDDEKITPLTASLSRRYNESTFAFLLREGADPLAQAPGRRSAAQLAVILGNLSAVEAMRTYDAKLGALDGKGCGVLEGAGETGDRGEAPEIVRLLVREEGADPSRPCYRGATPLHSAARGGALKTAQALILAGARLDAQDDDGVTPLFLAAEKGDAKMAALLLEKGADPTLRSRNVSPAMAAEAKGHGAIARTLAKAEKTFSARAQPATPARPASSEVDAPKRRFPESPSDFALVVGVEKYANGLPDAQFAERDAEAVRANLAALGVPDRNIKVLTGSRASLSAMTALVEDWLAKSARPDGRVFFYFSGHGSPDAASGQVFLVPHDGMPSLLEKTAYPVKRLYESLGALPSRQVVVMLDACFSGMGGRSVLPEGARPLVARASASLPQGSRLLLFAAAGPKQITATLPAEGHGLFTYHLLKGLGGAAADSDGVITPMGLYDYLRPKVQDEAARQDREQTPVLEGAVTGELVPAPPKP